MMASPSGPSYCGGPCKRLAVQQGIGSSSIKGLMLLAVSLVHGDRSVEVATRLDVFEEKGRSVPSERRSNARIACDWRRRASASLNPISNGAASVSALTSAHSAANSLPCPHRKCSRCAFGGASQNKPWSRFSSAPSAQQRACRLSSAPLLALEVPPGSVRRTLFSSAPHAFGRPGQ
jgi:hypothetical protein